MASANDLPQSEGVPSTAPRWRFRLIVVLVGIVATAVVARAARGSPEAREQEAAAARSAQPGGMTNTLVPGGPTPGGNETAPPPEEKSTFDTLLPYISEGGIAMILGLLLGMVTRSIFKIFIVLSILGFIGVQYLAHKGVVQVDWGALKDFVLNMVPKGADAVTLVQKKLPSLGAFGLGYLLGLKKG